jgi:hypothetical protein
MRTTAIAAALLVLGLGHAARAQLMIVPPPNVQMIPQPGQMVGPPAMGLSTSPMPGLTVAGGRRTARNPGVLNGFSSTGGIGTTPYLGNTRGMGGYSVNYDRRAVRPRMGALGYRVRRGWGWNRGMRRWR